MHILLHMCVNVCVSYYVFLCMCIFLCISMYVWMGLCVCIYVCVCVCVCVCACIYNCLFVCVSACSCEYMYICAYVLVCINVYNALVHVYSCVCVCVCVCAMSIKSLTPIQKHLFPRPLEYIVEPPQRSRTHRSRLKTKFARHSRQKIWNDEAGKILETSLSAASFSSRYYYLNGSLQTVPLYSSVEMFASWRDNFSLIGFSVPQRG